MATAAASRKNPSAASAKPGTANPAATPPAAAPEGREGVVTKRKDLVDRVVAEIGGRKGGVREIVEAMLTEMGAAIDRGEDLLLPPLGRLRVIKSKSAETGGAATVTLKLRKAGTGPRKDGKAPLADDGEDS